MWYNTRVLYVMAIQSNTKKGRTLRVASAEVQRKKPEGPLYYILPLVLVLGVIIFCHVAKSPAGGKQPATPAPAAVTE